MNQKNKSLYSISIDGCNIRTILQYNLNTNHIGISTSHYWKKKYNDSHKNESKEYYKNNKQQIDDRIKKYDEINKGKISEYKKLHYKINKDQIMSQIKEYQEINRDPNKIRKNSKDFRIMRSCIAQGINRKDWNGFIGKHPERDYVLSKELCTKLNSRFNNSHFHHITRSIGVYIPKDLHNHIKHDIRKGENMGEINMLSLQFIEGDYNF